MTNVHHIHTEAAQATFEDFWQLFPASRRGSKPIAQAKWNAITNGGLATKAKDTDSGGYVEIFLQATPEEILAGLKTYIKQRTPKESYTVDLTYFALATTFLNRGLWME